MADVSTRRPAPSAAGTLAATPLPHVLVYARNRRLTGEFELHEADRHAVITFWRGQIAAVSTTPSPCFFGTVAYELGLIDAPTLDATLLEVATTKRLHGEILVERGALTPAQRDEILVEQTCRKVHHLFTFPESAAYAFFDAPAGETEPPVLVDPIAPVWRGIREFRPTASLAAVLERYAPKALRVLSEAPIDRIGFTPEEKELVAALAKTPMTVAQMQRASSIGADRVDLIAYLLLIAKCVEPTSPSQVAMPAVTGPAMSPSWASMPAAGGGAGSGAIRRPPSFNILSQPGMPAVMAAPRPLADQAKILGPVEMGAEDIAARAKALDGESCCQALGLQDGASIEAARAAYFRLSKLWHPSRLPAELAEAEANVSAIFEHMTRAHHTLTDPDARRAYLAVHKPTLAKPRREVLREVEMLLSRRDFLGAEAEARRLSEAAPEDAEALALLAWSTAWGGDAPEDAVRAAVAELDRAVGLDRKCERAYFYRGMLHKRLDSAAAALRDFQRTAQINPRHVEATREVRLAEMRTRKSSGEHLFGALFSKLKK